MCTYTCATVYQTFDRSDLALAVSASHIVAGTPRHLVNFAQFGLMYNLPNETLDMKYDAG